MSEVNAAPTDPNKTLSIVALILAFVASLIGAILGIVAYTKSKKAGYKNGLALAAIIIGFVIFVIQIISFVVLVVVGVGAVNSMCDGLEAGQYETTTGQSVTCP